LDESGFKSSPSADVSANFATSREIAGNEGAADAAGAFVAFRPNGTDIARRTSVSFRLAN
jgi:hypothetical protein